MAMPANVTTVVVRGTFITPEGAPSTGTITFTPSRWLTNSGADVAIPNSSVTKTLGTAGNFSVTLPITDDSDLQPANWFYTVSEVVDGVSQSYAILLPGTAATNGTVYLADIAPAGELGPEYASLRGPAGEAATLAIGSTTSVANAGTASVTNVGTNTNGTLNFTLRDGPTGPQGVQGIQGVQGNTGTLAVGSVTSVNNAGTASVTNVGSSTAGTFNFVLRDGPTGPANSLTIGTVTTVATGGSATASITGLAPTQVLNLGIPTGPVGSAASITLGTTGSVPNSGTASVTNTGTSGSAVFNFILRDGPTGPANTLTIGTVTTVAPGGTATASITGTAPSQVLNLGIPTGATGTITSAGSGSVGTAAVAPTGDPDTGIYFPAANQVAVTTGGTQALLLAAGAVSNPKITGVATFAAGTVSAPAITTTGDTNTGIFFPAADTVAIAEGGVEVLRVNSSGQVSVPDGSASAPSITNTGDENTGIFFPNADEVSISTNGTARLTVTNGSVAATSVADYAITSATANEPRFGATNTSNDATAGIFLARKSRAGGAVSNNDLIGVVSFRPHDGTAFRDVVNIRGEIDGSVATSDVPTRLTFFTSPSGGVTPTERMRIDRNGFITGTGTSLGAWVTSFTPTITGTGWAIGNAAVATSYMRLGKMVIYTCRIVFGNTSTFGAGTFTIDLPVTAATAQARNTISSGDCLDASAGAIYSVRPRLSSTTTLQFITNHQGPVSYISSAVPFTWADTDHLAFGIVYEGA